MSQHGVLGLLSPMAEHLARPLGIRTQLLHRREDMHARLAALPGAKPLDQVDDVDMFATHDLCSAGDLRQRTCTQICCLGMGKRNIVRTLTQRSADEGSGCTPIARQSVCHEAMSSSSPKHISSSSNNLSSRYSNSIKSLDGSAGADTADDDKHAEENDDDDSDGDAEKELQWPVTLPSI